LSSVQQAELSFADAVPMLRDNELVGSIHIYRQEVLAVYGQATAAVAVAAKNLAWSRTIDPSI
jgi:hypothetical protein